MSDNSSENSYDENDPYYDTKLPDCHYAVECRSYPKGGDPNCAEPQGNAVSKRVHWFARRTDHYGGMRHSKVDAFRAWDLQSPDEDLVFTEPFTESLLFVLGDEAAAAARDLPASELGTARIVDVFVDEVPKEKFVTKSAVGADGTIRYWRELHYTLSFGCSDDYWGLEIKCDGKEIGYAYQEHEWLRK